MSTCGRRSAEALAFIPHSEQGRPVRRRFTASRPRTVCCERPGIIWSSSGDPGAKAGGANATRHAGLEWRPVTQLRPGDRVVQVQHLPDLGGATLPDGELATQPLLQFLGAFMGDGCFNGNWGVRLCIPKTDRVRVHYEQLAQSLFTKHADRHYAHPNRRIRDGSTEQMLALRAQGWTRAAIAARFGLSRGSVQDRLRMATRTLRPSGPQSSAPSVGTGSSSRPRMPSTASSDTAWSRGRRSSGCQAGCSD